MKTLPRWAVGLLASLVAGAAGFFANELVNTIRWRYTHDGQSTSLFKSLISTTSSQATTDNELLDRVEELEKWQAVLRDRSERKPHSDAPSFQEQLFALGQSISSVAAEVELMKRRGG